MMGLGLTLIVLLAEAVHPCKLVTVTWYKVEGIAGNTVTAGKVELEAAALHW
jgi:hypothetical protein